MHARWETVHVHVISLKRVGLKTQAIKAKLLWLQENKSNSRLHPCKCFPLALKPLISMVLTDSEALAATEMGKAVLIMTTPVQHQQAIQLKTQNLITVTTGFQLTTPL